ncbi:hypothetical protein HanIR_Chr04g0175921 [Helianthus annuus]|nr:hypothetical protein HanIR_Chr04g0175921 [Helianthus annuus]
MVPIQFGSQNNKRIVVPNRFGTSNQFNLKRCTTSFRYDCELRLGTPRSKWTVANPAI